MEIRVQCECEGYPVDVVDRVEDDMVIGEWVKGLVADLKAAGIGPRRMGKGGFQVSVEAWARAEGVRAFCTGDGKKALEWTLEPEEGSFEARKAMSWEAEALLEKLPEKLALAVKECWATGDKRGKEFRLSSVAVEVGFGGDPGRLKAVEVRQATKDETAKGAKGAKEKTEDSF